MRLSGYKTYIVCAISIVYAVAGASQGHMTWDSAIHLIFNALAAAGIRDGINAVNKPVVEAEKSESDDTKKRKR